MAPELVDGAGNIKVAVGVDAHGDLLGSSCAMVVMAVSLLDKG